MPIEGMGRCGGTATFSMFHNFGAPKAWSFQWVKIRPVPSALYLEVESQPRPPWFTRHHLLHICQCRQIHLAGPIDGQLALPRAQQQRFGRHTAGTAARAASKGINSVSVIVDHHRRQPPSHRE